MTASDGTNTSDASAESNLIVPTAGPSPAADGWEAEGEGRLNGASLGKFEFEIEKKKGFVKAEEFTYVSKPDNINFKMVKPAPTFLLDEDTLTATFEGTGILKGVGIVPFTLVVHDGGKKGNGDTFDLTINSTTVYTTGTQTLKSGNIKIERDDDYDNIK